MVAARLASHDRQIAAIGDSVTALVGEVKTLTTEVQLQGAQAEERAREVVITAKVLKDAHDAQRRRDDDRWTPFKRFAAVLAAIATVTTIIGFFATR